MTLSELTLRQFRSYDEARFAFDPQLTLVTGDNGAGKTNLLEAVYVLLTGTSFRVADRDLVRHDRAWWRLDGLVDDEPRQLRYQPDQHPAKQLVTLDTKKGFRYRDRLPVVLFEPTDLLLLHGSPSRRRDAFDTMLSSLSQRYKLTLGRYERTLLQRNNLLRQNPPDLTDRLFSWDVLLSSHGVELVVARAELAERLNGLLSDLYSQIAGVSTSVQLGYQSSLGARPDTSHYVATLHRHLPLDRQRGTTSTGPHRDDYTFELRGDAARLSASRGETRTLVLSLKLA
ncbi:MAG TPA: DNA replication and repair protein RecF, partial [Candidatus Saccharimonadales bacterium]